MEIFVAVVETGKFTLAADMLGLSKSAVSHAIRDLEEYLNFQCIRRDQKGLNLTAAGQEYFEQCCRILADINELESGFRHNDKELVGNINMTAPVGFGGAELSAVIANFIKENPDIRISLELTNTLVNLMDTGVDVAIRICSLPTSTYMMRFLKTIEMCLCASPEFLQNMPLISSLEDVKKLPCLKYSNLSDWVFRANGSDQTISPPAVFASDSGYALREMALAGVGVTFLPKFLVAKDLEKGDLERVLPAFKGRDWHAYAVFAPNRHRSQRVRGLIDFLEKTFASQ